MAASLRSLLRQHIVELPDGRAKCKHCDAPFSAGSDSAAWKAHLSSRHHSQYQAVLAAAPPPRKLAMTTPTEEVESISSPSPTRISVASSSASAPRQQSIAEALQTHSSKAALGSLARPFVQSSIAHHVIDTPEFKEFCRDIGWRGPLPTRYALKDSVLSQAATLRTALVTALRRLLSRLHQTAGPTCAMRR